MLNLAVFDLEIGAIITGSIATATSRTVSGDIWLGNHLIGVSWKIRRVARNGHLIRNDTDQEVVEVAPGLEITIGQCDTPVEVLLQVRDDMLRCKTIDQAGNISLDESESERDLAGDSLP